ncbi:MAG: alcohol dehydrogenase [Haliea sp.]|jgi:NAD(P)-dependent dehydrogenase (short-subunit alcohol dehydrogenase family)|uniref:SDR family NAD(P)-dependent oxidoreductase n=1 Tax=Haliea sp. TaxID=1932666 RepID=UPI000C65D0F7|nr:SDR family NAD(P)-dependent oxidoreductase [Haliea sp.]MBM68784.1 alcohol dehydrogenase [Haliea sp.]|tara:strand:+ start:43907 stop:44788 length:882 start_codon:yes stop_codon:yes gene_type:complete
MQDFTGKVAVITGGASGVGRSLAFALGRRGARIVVGDVDEAAMQDIDQALAAEGIEARVAHCDVTSAASLESLANVASEHFGGVQLVFANAGIGAGESGAMWDYSEKDWQWCFNVNIWGVINSIRVFMPRLIAANEPAHFVVTGSGNGALLVFPDAPIYTASKAAVHAITENLHYQVQAAQSPVKVSALFPGPHVVETGLFNSGRVRPEALKKEVEGNASGISSVEDMKRMAAEYGIELQTTHPDEVAAMAVAGLEQDAFWLLATTPETDEKIRARAEMILNRTTPVPAMVGG